MHKLVLIRHGQSLWNKENKFTGWYDVDLSEQGIEEAKQAGKKLKENGFEFDMAFTSVLLRANRTLDLVLNEMGIEDLPTQKSWRLNERHYGALQGFNKAEMAQEKGEEQVHIWRRSYDVRPPALEPSDPRHPKNDPLYADLEDHEIPDAECLKDTYERLMPYWENEIAPAIKSGKRIVITAHGNSLRALVKHLDNISDQEIPSLNIPTGKPLIYELDEDLKPLKSYYLE